MRRYRFTVRRMMIAVAIVGTAMGLMACGLRWHSRLRKAEDLRLSEMMLLLTARDLAPGARDNVGSNFNDRLPDGTPIRVERLGTGRRVFIPAGSKVPADDETIKAAIEAILREASKIHRLRIKYQRAARQPWLSIPVDVPG
ncbi:MAG: hypothetical protein JWN86_4185 [Planctomycetota bacterium]|nr:hypothetical protein [Planctomycetota bacterium]